MSKKLYRKTTKNNQPKLDEIAAFNSECTFTNDVILGYDSTDESIKPLSSINNLNVANITADTGNIGQITSTTVTANSIDVSNCINVTCDINIGGNLHVCGTEYITDIEQVKSCCDKILLRDGSVSGLVNGCLSGIEVNKYDGTNNTCIGVDNYGTLRVGDSGTCLEPVMTRSETSNLIDGGLLYWDTTNTRAVNGGIKYCGDGKVYIYDNAVYKCLLNEDDLTNICSTSLTADSVTVNCTLLADNISASCSITISGSPVITCNDLQDLNLTHAVETTYDCLLSCVNSCCLTPGQIYIITDYATTTGQTDTFVCNNICYDIIVCATSNNKLNADARARSHTGCTYPDNCPEKWILKYDIYNCPSCYCWACTAAGGKGVVYYLLDEFNNELWYDFYNIGFIIKCCCGTACAYAFNVESPYSCWACRAKSNPTTTFTWCGTQGVYGHCPSGTYSINNNHFCPMYCGSCMTLPFNIFGCITYFNTFGNNARCNTFGSCIISNTFGYNTGFNTFGNCTSFNKFGNTALYNTFGSCIISNTFGNWTVCNTFGNNTCINKFSDYTCFNQFGNCIYCNKFGNGICSNVFNNCFFCNKFGDCARSNGFGCCTYSNTFGNCTFYNTTAYNIYCNKFGNWTVCNTLYSNFSCNTFGDNTCYNTFCIGTNNNIFSCCTRSNTFGCYTRSNTFGRCIVYNTFGTNTMYNTFGNYTTTNVFDDNIHDIKFSENLGSMQYYMDIVNDNNTESGGGCDCDVYCYEYLSAGNEACFCDLPVALQNILGNAAAFSCINSSGYIVPSVYIESYCVYERCSDIDWCDYFSYPRLHYRLYPSDNISDINVILCEFDQNVCCNITISSNGLIKDGQERVAFVQSCVSPGCGTTICTCVAAKFSFTLNGHCCMQYISFCCEF